jgi:hypothetical protein
MNIYAYYQSIPASNQTEEFQCANLWKASWTKAGWNPVMLNRSHAQNSSMYNKLQQKLASTFHQDQRLVARSAWHHARFARWCALHAAGGGWMSDYDVLNVGLDPKAAWNAVQDSGKTLLANDGPTYLVYATAEHCLAAIRKMILEDLSEDGAIRPEREVVLAAPLPESVLQGVLHCNYAPVASAEMADQWLTITA